jgi:hypothetical protein
MLVISNELTPDYHNDMEKELPKIKGWGPRCALNTNRESKMEIPA